MFVNGCLLPGDSIVFFTYAELMTVLKVYRSACMLYGGCWNVFRDRLGVGLFGVKFIF